jgi:shikimate 5-dehydrogenase
MNAAYLTAGAALAGMMGWPIHHSLSPRLHGFWLRQHRIEASGDQRTIVVAGLGETVLDFRRTGAR